MTWILLRGLIREGRHWEAFPELLRARLPGETVLTPELPGNGALFRESSPTAVCGMLEALRYRLFREGHRPPFRVAALSLGAMVTVEWLCRWPEELASAALINTSSGRFSPFWHRLRPPVYGRLVRDVLFGSDPVSRELAILEITSNLRSREELQTLARRWADYQREFPVSPANTLRQLWAAARFRAPARLPGQAPVTVINGGADRLVHPRCSEALSRGWGLPLIRHPQAGHDLPLDAPDWLVERLVEATGMAVATPG